jgi:hypothetical protein
LRGFSRKAAIARLMELIKRLTRHKIRHEAISEIAAKLLYESFSISSCGVDYVKQWPVQCCAGCNDVML